MPLDQALTGWRLLPFVTPIECSLELPRCFPSPFDELGPHPLARHAAELLQAQLRTGLIAEEVPTSLLEDAEGGKMFGVLVVRDQDGQLGFLRSFSGMLAGRWLIEGFVPPLFDSQLREAIEPAGDARVKAMLSEEASLSQSELYRSLLAERRTMLERHEAENLALRGRHATNKQERHASRATAMDEAARHALDQQSRRDKAERRSLDARQEAERHALLPRIDAIEHQLQAMEAQRIETCRSLMQQIHGSYVIRNTRGEQRQLRDLYAPNEPPGGAADCAAPKLLGYAFAHGLEPIALAEFWWGAPPRTGGRVSGAYYPACRDKCNPLLPFMLQGLEVSPPRIFVPPAMESAPLNIVFEDEWLVIVNKPAGLLSVPGKSEGLSGSVLSRLQSKYERAFLVHRLDLDTSGLLVGTKDEGAYVDLQRQFAGREVQKRYVAWLAGEVKEERGVIDFPMRVDLNDRPRQILDPVYGKPSTTEWEVLDRRDGRTRVAFYPLTGRTHQLRVHASHPLGLGTPIVGDRLYGYPDERLFLHAEAIRFVHPKTGEPLSLECPAPF